VRIEYNHALATSDINPDLLTAPEKFDKDNTSWHYALKLLEGRDESEDEAM
jgi:hypothetical protein